MMMMMKNFTNNTRNTRIDALTPTPAVNNDNRFRIGDNKIQTPNSLNLKNTNEPNNQAADNFLDLDTYGSSREAKVGANITGYSNTTTLFSPSSGYSMNPQKESLFEDGNFFTNIISHYSPGLNNDNKNNDYSNHYQATTKLPSFSTDLINIDLEEEEEEEEEEERGGGETHSTGIIPAQKIPPIISLGSESLFGQATAATAPAGSTITSNPPLSTVSPNPLYLPVQTQIYSQLQNEGIGKNHNYPPSSSTPSNNSLKKPKTGFSSVYSSPTPYLNHENLHQSYFLGLTDPYATATTSDNIAITQISTKTTTVNPIVSSTNNSYHKKYGKDSSTKSPGVNSMKNKVNFNNLNNSDSSSCDGYHCSDSSCCCSSTDSSSPSSSDNDISLSNRKKRRRKRISYRVDGEEAVSSSSYPPLMLSPRKSQLQESENNNNNSNNRRREGDTGDCVGGRATTLGALLLEPLGVKNKAGAVAERSAGGTGDDDDDFDGKKKASALWANSNPTTTDVVIKENGSAVAATTNSSYSISANRSSNTILGVPSSSVCAGFISSSGSCRRKTEDRERKEEELEEEREEEEENVVGYYHKHCHYSSSSSCVQKKKQSSSCRECRRLFEVNNNNNNRNNNNNNDVPKFAASSDDNDVGAEEDNGGTGGGAGGEDEGLNRESRRRRRTRKGKEEENEKEEEDEEEEDYSEKQQLLVSSSSTYKYRTSGGGVGSNISSSNSSRGPQKKPDNRWWWGSRKNKNNRRWWYPVVGRKGLLLPRTRKKRALQELHNLELSEDFSLEDDEGGGVTTTPYTTTGSVSFVVDDDDDDGDDGGVGPSRPLLLHCNKPYHKQVTPGEQQEQQPEDCHRYHHHEHHRQHYHHHHHRRHRLQKQQSSPYHYCRRSTRRHHHHCPQVGEKEDPEVDRQHYHRHHHHRHQQQKQIHHHHHHEGDGDGEPLYLQEQQQDPFYRPENNCKEGHCYCYYSCRRVRGSASATPITRTTTTLTADNNNYSPSPTYHGCHHDDDDQEEGEEEEEEKEEKEVKKLGGIIRGGGGGGGRVGRWNRNRFRRGQEEATSTTMDSCTQCLKNEFKPENAGLHHEDPSVFVRSQWPLDHRLYVFYRIVVALGFIAWILADIIDETEKFYKDRFWIWFIFATNWSFILLTMTTIFEAICSSYYLLVARGFIDKFRYHKENADQQYFQEMPICLKIQWLLYNLGANTAIVITISYWSFIFFVEHSKFLMTNMSKMKHMLNTVYVVLDIFISATPIRIFHMLFPIMLGSIYAIFNASYFLNDGTILDGRHYAYNVLNWNVPAEAIVTCILCMAQTIFSQIILYHLAALRKWIASKIYKPHEPIPEHDSEMLSIMSADSTTYLATDSQNEGGAPGNFH